MKTILQPRRTSLPLALLAMILCRTGLAAAPVSSYATLSSALAQSTVITNFVNNSVISLTTLGQTFQITRNTIIDAGTNNVIIDGNNSTRLFYVHTNCQLILANLVLTNGMSTNGAAVFNNGLLVISNCVVSGNTGTNVMGLDGSAGTTNSPNGADGGSGGEVLGGAIYSAGPLFVYNSVFGANSAEAGAGGSGGAGLTIASTTSYAGYGGNGGNGGIASGAAIYSAGSNNVFSDVEFLGNNCVGGAGGAGGPMGINSSYYSLGAGTGQGGAGSYAAGGAVFVTGSLSMSNCLFAYNSVTGGNSAAAAVNYNHVGNDGSAGASAYGGGLLIYDTAASAYLENSIFFQNTCAGGAGADASGTSTSGGDGGGAYGGGFYTMATSAMMRNCTFATNSPIGGAGGAGSGTGGANGAAGARGGWDIYHYGGVARLANSILSGQSDNATGVTDAGYNISSDASLAKVDATTLLNTDPGLDSGLSAQGGPTLGPLGISNGPPTLTLALIAGSPATNVIPGVPGLSFPATDERLLPRGTPASIGAFEVDSDIISVTNMAPASITSQVADQVATLGKTAYLSVAATPNPSDPNTLGYQWQLNGTNLPEAGNFSGVNTPTLTIKDVTTANLGPYQVVISPSLLDSATNSATAFLLVNIPTTFKTQPASKLSVPVGSIVVFTVSVSGATPFSYQWRTNGVPLTDGNEFSGSSTTNLTVNPVTLSDAASYTVVVTNYFHSVTSAVARMTVVLDKTRPTVTISTPTASARTTNSLISGTAWDNAQVTNVLCRVTNIFAGITNVFSTNAVLSTNQTLTKTWAISNILSPGTNIVAAQSVDFSSNVSLVASQKFFYIVPSLFRFAENNLNDGYVTAAASVAGNTRPTNGAMLNLGEGYALTATASQGYLLSNWVAASFISYTNPLHFIMTSNLAIQANFVPTPFKAVPGPYNGLFFQTNTNGVTLQTAGMLKGLAIGSLGSYSADVLLGGVPYAISGYFDIFGHASNYIARAASAGGPVDIQMDLVWTNSQITGTVSGAKTNWQSPLYAEEIATASTSAESTMLLAPSTEAIGQTPPGLGYILVTNHLGALALSGALPDGTAFIQSVPLGKLGDVPLYESLYANAGLVLGWVTLTNDLPQATNGLIWIRPSAKSEFYPHGFTNLLDVQGSPWTNGPAFSTTGTLTISNTSLDLTYPVAITNDILTNKSKSTLSLTGTVTSKTGVVKITFTPAKGKPAITGYGAILENTSVLGGYFITTTNAGVISLQP
ncbi:MAG: immunoglobulin domain-containing protein [Verrucomicrobiota bacterium]